MDIDDYDIHSSLVEKFITKCDKNAFRKMLNMNLNSISAKLEKKGGVLVKTTKPKQKDSLVFPTIDSNTILKAKEANLDGIVINANYCRIIDINNTIKLANKKNIFILSI